MMKKSLLLIFILMITLVSTIAGAERIVDIVVGGNYYVKGFLSDSKVKVLEVDYASERVKVIDLASNEVDWISPSSLITRSESIGRDVDRAKTTMEILDSMFPQQGNSNRTSQWRAGMPHSRYPHVYTSDEVNVWVPENGYFWVDKENSWAVRWVEGLPHKSYVHVVASNSEGNWRPETGYVWVDKDNSWAVRWQEGKPYQYAHVVSSATEGNWVPEHGYVWVDKDNSWAVRWQEGKPHKQYAHVVSSATEGNWVPEDGYVWVDKDNSWEVRWKAGIAHKQYVNVVASENEGRWKPKPGYVWVDKDRSWEVEKSGFEFFKDLLSNR